MPTLTIQIFMKGPEKIGGYEYESGTEYDTWYFPELGLTLPGYIKYPAALTILSEFQWCVKAIDKRAKGI